jgi:Domain of unknown function (DUF4338)
MPRAIRGALALLGAPSPAGVGLPALDLSGAWKRQARDAWIGWNDKLRQSNLQGVVNNGRFLILPWVHVECLAGKTLALSARQMPYDWDPLRVSSPAPGNSGGCGAVLRHVLSSCQRDPPRPNCRARSHGSRTYHSRSSRQKYLSLSLGARRAAATMPRPRRVSIYDGVSHSVRWDSSFWWLPIRGRQT